MHALKYSGYIFVISNKAWLSMNQAWSLGLEVLISRQSQNVVLECLGFIWVSRKHGRSRSRTSSSCLHPCHELHINTSTLCQWRCCGRQSLSLCSATWVLREMWGVMALKLAGYLSSRGGDRFQGFVNKFLNGLFTAGHPRNRAVSKQRLILDPHLLDHDHYYYYTYNHNYYYFYYQHYYYYCYYNYNNYYYYYNNNYCVQVFKQAVSTLGIFRISQLPVSVLLLLLFF